LNCSEAAGQNLKKDFCDIKRLAKLSLLSGSRNSNMDFSTYQNGARKTAVYPEAAKVIYPALGLSGEAGEVANQVKKILRDNAGELTEERRTKIIDELGDVLYGMLRPWLRTLESAWMMLLLQTWRSWRSERATGPSRVTSGNNCLPCALGGGNRAILPAFRSP